MVKEGTQRPFTTPHRCRKYLFCCFSAYLQVPLALYNYVALHGFDVGIRPPRTAPPCVLISWDIVSQMAHETWDKTSHPNRDTSPITNSPSFGYTLSRPIGGGERVFMSLHNETFTSSLKKRKTTKRRVLIQRKEMDLWRPKKNAQNKWLFPVVLVALFATRGGRLARFCL